MLPYGRQQVDEADIAAVVAVLRGDWLTQGPSVAAFEETVADKVGARHAVAFSSGTAGLHGAAAVAGLGPPHRVAVPSLTFVATANCAAYTGAEIRFVDIDPSTLNIDLSAVPRDVSALIVTHFAGLPLDLSVLDHRFGTVIEDAAHALGAIGPSGPIGNCAHSDMCVFSFHPLKSITTGEGGMVTTNSAELAERLKRFRHHNIEVATSDEPWENRIAKRGFNYRLSDIHAALGRQQLTRLEEFIDQRNELADRYDYLLAGFDVMRPPRAAPKQRHARHIYPIRVTNRASVYHYLHSQGIRTQVHYPPLHKQPLFKTADRHLPETEMAGAELLSLPLFPGLSTEDQDRVVSALGKAVLQP